MTHVCENQSDINIIINKVERLESIIDGNSQRKGLSEIVIRMDENLTHFTDITKQLKTSMNGILIYQKETQAALQEGMKHRSSRRWLITTIISLGMFLIGCIGFILKLINHIGI